MLTTHLTQAVIAERERKQALKAAVKR
jgi:hypothetical protein